jgi:hypothetical protein
MGNFRGRVAGSKLGEALRAKREVQG